MADHSDAHHEHSSAEPHSPKVDDSQPSHGRLGLVPPVIPECELVKLKYAFSLFDHLDTKEHSIDGAEVAVYLRALDPDITNEAICHRMLEADHDGDGRVHLQQFLDMVVGSRHTFKHFEVDDVDRRIINIKSGKLFRTSLEKNFRGALPESEFVKRLYEAAVPYGFTKDNTMAAVSLCRDEICKPLLEVVVKTWGEAFNVNGLAGMVFVGKTGLSAALHHAPIIHGKERYLFLACPHIAIDSYGDIGYVFRYAGTAKRGLRKKSPACGALKAFLNEIESGESLTILDTDDIEYSFMKQKLLASMPYGSKPSQVELTKLAMKVIKTDLERLIAKTVSTKHADYIVACGVQIHGPHWMDKRSDMDYVWPREIYAMVNGERHEIKLGVTTEDSPPRSRSPSTSPSTSPTTTPHASFVADDAQKKPRRTMYPTWRLSKAGSYFKTPPPAPI